MVIYTYTVFKDYKAFTEKKSLTHFSVLTNKEYNDRLRDLAKSNIFKSNSPSKYLFLVEFRGTDPEDTVPETLHPLFEETI